MQEIIADVERWIRSGEAVALATVIQTWGSAPRGVGAKMALTPSGKICGSVSGGCVEGAVFEAGVQAIQEHRAKLLHFGVADEMAFSVGLACGGNIDIFVRPLDATLFEAAAAQVRAALPAAIVTVIGGPPDLLGREALVAYPDRMHGALGGGLDDPARQLAVAGMQSERSCSAVAKTAEGEDVTLFIDVLMPPPVLVMVGGVHIAITLATLAKALGFRTVVIDPRRAFGNLDRFPHVDQLIQAWPDDAFRQVPLTSATAVAMLTHDPKIDDPALKIALNSPVFYIGALGSRKTHEQRRRRLLQEGITPEQLERLHAPIGLDLGGRTPEETALAILAEIVAVRNGRLGAGEY